MDYNEVIKQGLAILGALVTGGGLTAWIQSRSAKQANSEKVLNEIRVDQQEQLEQMRAEIRNELKCVKAENELKDQMLHNMNRRLDRLTLICNRLVNNLAILLGFAKPKLPEQQYLIQQIENDSEQIKAELVEVQIKPSKPP